MSFPLPSLGDQAAGPQEEIQTFNCRIFYSHDRKLSYTIVLEINNIKQTVNDIPAQAAGDMLTWEQDTRMQFDRATNKVSILDAQGDPYLRGTCRWAGDTTPFEDEEEPPAEGNDADQVAPEGAAASARPKTGVQWYLEAFYGPRTSGQASISASHRPGSLFGTAATSSLSAQVDVKSSSVVGMRWGLWGHGEARYLGIAAELNYISFDSDASALPYQVHASGTAVGIVPMLRYPFLRSEDRTDGRAFVYVGGMMPLPFLSFGSVRVNGPELTESVGGSADVSTSAMMIGGKVLLSRFAFFAELRWQKTKIDYDHTGLTMLFGTPEVSSASASYSATLVLAGVTINY